MLILLICSKLNNYTHQLNRQEKNTLRLNFSGDSSVRWQRHGETWRKKVQLTDCLAGPHPRTTFQQLQEDAPPLMLETNLTENVDFHIHSANIAYNVNTPEKMKYCTKCTMQN